MLITQVVTIADQIEAVEEALNEHRSALASAHLYRQQAAPDVMPMMVRHHRRRVIQLHAVIDLLHEVDLVMQGGQS